MIINYVLQYTEINQFKMFNKKDKTLNKIGFIMFPF